MNAFGLLTHYSLGNSNLTMMAKSLYYYKNCKDGNFWLFGEGGGYFICGLGINNHELLFFRVFGLSDTD